MTGIRAVEIAAMDDSTRYTQVTKGEWHGWMWQLHDGTTRGIGNRQDDPEGFDTGALAARLARTRRQVQR